MAYFILGGQWTDEERGKYADQLDLVYFEELDGDTNFVELVDRTQDEGRRITAGSVNAGRPLKPDHIPTKLERKPCSLEELPLLDVETFDGANLLVSQAFKDLLEELEPDVHQFWPMEIYIKGEMVGLRYWFIACHRIAALSKEHCSPKLDKYGYWEASKFGHTENDRVVFSRDSIGDRHAWVDKMYGDRLFSDEFGDRLKKLNLTGVELSKIEEASDIQSKPTEPRFPWLSAKYWFGK
ncbi:imm11 family protein [Loktanella sp. S4079]|uniref:imm11 family protein n=1 Tax=Loktanella sp. S4079 TaxID=579483 RepID=UPI0005F9C068|nr:DUF1629 domain-containing protein [Loktanella sp. S4079]KJZ20378.1 hypothetical protein TW80_06135 [Loktanella sp. S4079]